MMKTVGFSQEHFNRAASEDDLLLWVRNAKARSLAKAAAIRPDDGGIESSESRDTDQESSESGN